MLSLIQFLLSRKTVKANKKIKKVFWSWSWELLATIHWNLNRSTDFDHKIWPIEPIERSVTLNYWLKTGLNGFSAWRNVAWNTTTRLKPHKEARRKEKSLVMLLKAKSTVDSQGICIVNWYLCLLLPLTCKTVIYKKCEWRFKYQTEAGYVYAQRFKKLNQMIGITGYVPEVRQR